MRAGIMFGDSVSGQVTVELGAEPFKRHTIAAIYGLSCAAKLVYSIGKSRAINISIEIKYAGGRTYDHLCTIGEGGSYQYQIIASGGVWSFGFNEAIAGFVAPTPMVAIFYKPSKIHT